MSDPESRVSAETAAADRPEAVDPASSSDRGVDFRWAAGWSARGALAAGGVFLVVSVLRALGSGADPLAVSSPILALGVIGATVGALAGPLIGAIWVRLRGDGEAVD